MILRCMAVLTLGPWALCYGSDCAKCHKAQTASVTSMAHALQLVADCKILKEHPQLEFQTGEFRYEIKREGERSIYSVTRGKDRITVALGWAFGLGKAGQTYVFRYQGKLYESRVSFYQQLNRLDRTLGAAGMEPQNLLQAAGHEMDGREAKQCFDCHATNVPGGSEFHPETLAMGVQCERCHGDAQKHPFGGAAMPKLGGYTTEAISNFCGQCHRTWEQIASGGQRGIGTVRFQPYRLTNSKCYDTEDRRIACTACHDPHQEVVTKPAAYDSKCQACHSGLSAKARQCPTGTSNCSGCHMPKLELPGAHYQFTDHMIRIVKVNEKYPE